MKKKLTHEDVIIITKQKIETLLKRYTQPIQLEQAELYVVEDKKIIDELLDIETFLLDYKSDTNRGKKFILDTFIQIINPMNPFIPIVKYNLNIVEKYPNVTMKGTALKYLKSEKAVSANFHLKRVEEQIKENEYSEDFKIDLRKKVEKLIEKEGLRIQEVLDNSNEYSQIRICGHQERKSYAQLNYKYFEIEGNEKKKVTNNVHLSTKKPSLLIFREDLDYIEEKINMEAKYLLNNGYEQISRRVFIKKKGIDE